MSDQSASIQLKHRREDILSRVSRVVLDISAKDFREFLLSAHDRIMEHVEQPTASRERFELLHDRAQLNANRSHVSRVFQRSLERQYALSAGVMPQFKPDESEIDHRRMQLVADDDVEENVALVNARQHAENEFNTSLWALGQRMAMLNGGQKVPLKDLPMAPVHYCAALQEAIADLSTVGKLYLYKLFDQLFLRRLGRVIRNIFDGDFHFQKILHFTYTFGNVLNGIFTKRNGKQIVQVGIIAFAVTEVF